jgi:hypothetical protein
MAVLLDAASKYFSAADAALIAAMTGVSQFSISSWAYILNDAKDHDYICWGPHSASTAGWLYWRDDVASTSGRTNTISGLTYPPDQRAEGATGLWNDYNWHHWVYTWIGNTAGGQRHYKDGVLDPNVGSTVGHATIAGYALPTPIRFGNVYPANATQWFHGGMDDIRLYNRILTPQEAQIIFTRRGTDAILNGLMLRYLLQDKAPGAVMDGTAGEVRDVGEFGYNARGDSGSAYASYQESAVLSGLRRRAA